LVEPAQREGERAPLSQVVRRMALHDDASLGLHPQSQAQPLLDGRQDRLVLVGLEQARQLTPEAQKLLLSQGHLAGAGERAGRDGDRDGERGDPPVILGVGARGATEADRDVVLTPSQQNRARRCCCRQVDLGHQRRVPRPGIRHVDPATASLPRAAETTPTRCRALRYATAERTLSQNGASWRASSATGQMKTRWTPARAKAESFSENSSARPTRRRARSTSSGR